MVMGGKGGRPYMVIGKYMCVVLPITVCVCNLCRYVVTLRQPSVSLREEMWRKLVPSRMPRTTNGIDYKTIAER